MGLFSKKENLSFVVATHDGTIEKLEALKDGVFSKKMLGDGISIAPSEDKYIVYAPTSGTLVTAFPTGHAFGIKTKDDKEVLIHIGVDTVNLDGKGFKTFVKQGQKVKRGGKLVEVDMTVIQNSVPSINTIIVITSGDKISDVAKGKVKTGDNLFKII